MKWLNFNSLRKRYAVLTVILAIIMLSFSWYTQNKINIEKNNIETNIKSRNTLIYQNRKIQNSIWQVRDLLFKFQADPQAFEGYDFISQKISNAISNIKFLSKHPWIKENHNSTASTLVNNLHDIDIISKNLIHIRLTPQELFPALKIANTTMQSLNGAVTENIQLAIKDIEDNYVSSRYEEYQTLIELRFYWTTMVSNFRMYLLNQLNAFNESHRANQLILIKDLHSAIQERLQILRYLNDKNKLEFTTAIAFEVFYPAANEWIINFNRVKKVNESEGWRTDTVIYQDKLKPKLEEVNALLLSLNLAIEEFSKNDLTTLSNTSQFQIKSIWTAVIGGLFIILLGFVFLVKLILIPIENITQALKDESKGITTGINPDMSILETKNLIHAFKEMRIQIHNRQQELEYHALHDELTRASQ